jgi:uncharacterized damage-inducible protein DinB
MVKRPKPKAKVKSEKKQVRFLLARLDAAWAKNKWHSLEGALEGLTEAEATWKPLHYKSPEPWGFSGSILEILFHVAADSLATINQFFGDRILTYEGVRERFQAQGGNLAAALALLDEGYTATRKALTKLTDRDLPKKVGKKKKWRVDNIFVGLIEHYLYHAGQINYIRCLWEGTKAE